VIDGVAIFVKRVNTMINDNLNPPAEPRPVSFKEIWAAGWIQSAILLGAVLAAIAAAYMMPL
jgi:hypothetical protein